MRSKWLRIRHGDVERAVADRSPGHGYIISRQTQLPPALLPVIGSVSASQAVTLFRSMKSDVLSQTSAVAHERRGGESRRRETMHAFLQESSLGPRQMQVQWQPQAMSPGVWFICIHISLWRCTWC